MSHIHLVRFHLFLLKLTMGLMQCIVRIIVLPTGSLSLLSIYVIMADVTRNKTEKHILFPLV